MKTVKHYLLLYGITTLLFLLYICILSDNNIARHRQLNRKIKELDRNIIQTKNQINNKYTYEELINSPILLEQYAREKMNMQKADEDVFIIVYE